MTSPTATTAIPATLTVCCATCRHFSLKQAGYTLASLGYGCCALNREPGHLFSACHPRLCATHVPATPVTTECRQAFITHHQEKQA